MRKSLHTQQQIAPEKYVHKVFHNIEFILSINSLFLKGLTERMEVQKSECVGDLFLKVVCFCTSYTFSFPHTCTWSFLFVLVLFVFLKYYLYFQQWHCCDVKRFLFSYARSPVSLLFIPFSYMLCLMHSQSLCACCTSIHFPLPLTITPFAVQLLTLIF